MGWSFQDNYALHDELGPIFTVVTPGGNEVSVADSEVVDRILAKRKEFIKPAVMCERLNIFGPGVDTASSPAGKTSVHDADDPRLKVTIGNGSESCQLPSSTRGPARLSGRKLYDKHRTWPSHGSTKAHKEHSTQSRILQLLPCMC
ncbi:hypothetical protein GJ744_007126 [Endocarpon pusillum]|uniref:Uncharacterized protein n=1 Tax=Endocarpon pusillum TaxID=364733 RepID=A0A8H7AN91_9EURO|nr:hypothetical protein GJ744_007126 [Endocarpon pusillum]